MEKDNISKLDEAQKKPATKKEEYLTSLKNYVVDTLISGAKILVWVILSLIMIYACKLAQSNILPTDINCYPYTKEVHNPTPIQTNIFTNLPFSNPRKSMKMSFDVDGSDFVNGILKSLRDAKEDVKTGIFGNYFYSIMESVLKSNYSYYNFILSFLNALPEFLIVIIGPYIGYYLLIIGSFLTAFNIFWYWISNLGWFFKKNNSIKTNPDGTITYEPGPVKWVNLSWKKYKNPETDKEQSDWILCILMFIIAMIFIGLISSAFVLLIPIGAFINLFCIISFFTYSMKLENKDASFTDLFKYFFRYNKLIIMTMFAYYVVLNAYTQLGATSAGFAVLTIFLIYYLKIIEMFVPVGGEDARTSPLASDKQAKKVPCEKPKTPTNVSASTKGAGTPVTSEPKKSFFGSLLGSKNVSAQGPAEPKKSMFGSLFGSKKVAAPVAPVVATPEASVAVAPAVAPVEPVALAPVATGETPPVAPPQSGGIKVNKKIKQVGDNLINELKKFNNKYAQFLL
jgi:hypothetical protein